MKKKLIISVVLAVILAATMSIGCFAIESTWGLNTNRSFKSSNGIYTLASVTREYSYSSTSFTATCTLSVQSKTISGDWTNSKINLVIKELNIDYSDALTLYNNNPGSASSFDEYIRENAPYLNYTSIGGYPGQYTTSSDNTTQYFPATADTLYYYDNVFHSFIFLNYHKFSGSLDYSVVFGLDTNSQPHYFYS